MFTAQSENGRTLSAANMNKLARLVASEFFEAHERKQARALFARTGTIHNGMVSISVIRD